MSGRKERWGRGRKKGKGEKNLREWDSQDRGRTETRAKKELS